jgi:dCMP deaminase
MKIPPRQVCSRDQFYMSLAFWYASRSKDPRTQVGACIVSKDNVNLSFGYNGPPARIKDADINWDRPDKYPFIVHAEANSIRRVKIREDMDGATIYVTGKPCSACMLEIADTKISKVIYMPAKVDENSMLANKNISLTTDEIAKLAGISLVEFNESLSWMEERMEIMRTMDVFNI